MADALAGASVSCLGALGVQELARREMRRVEDAM